MVLREGNIDRIVELLVLHGVAARLCGILGPDVLSIVGLDVLGARRARGARRPASVARPRAVIQVEGADM